MKCKLTIFATIFHLVTLTSSRISISFKVATFKVTQQRTFDWCRANGAKSFSLPSNVLLIGVELMVPKALAYPATYF